MSKGAKFLAAFVASAVLLTGCGGGTAASFAKDNYSLENADNSGSTLQKVYRVSGKSVSAVAAQLASEQKPDEMSKQDDHDMFLVYNDQIIHVEQDPEQPADTLVEIDSKQYVQDNYDPNYLSSFLTGALIGSMFGNNWQSSGREYGHYYGYSDYKYRSKYPSKSYPGQYKPPTSSSGSSGYGTSTKPSTSTTPSSGSATKPPTSSTPSSGSTSKPSTSSTPSSGSTSKPSSGSTTPAQPPKSSSGTGQVIKRDSGSSSSKSSGSSSSGSSSSRSSGGSSSSSKGSSSSSKRK